MDLRRPIMRPRMQSAELPPLLPGPAQPRHNHAMLLMKNKQATEAAILHISQQIFEYCQHCPPQTPPVYNPPTNEDDLALYEANHNYEDANIAAQYPYMAQLPHDLDALLREKVGLLRKVRQLDLQLHTEFGMQDE